MLNILYTFCYTHHSLFLSFHFPYTCWILLFVETTLIELSHTSCYIRYNTSIGYRMPYTFCSGLLLGHLGVYSLFLTWGWVPTPCERREYTPELPNKFPSVELTKKTTKQSIKCFHLMFCLVTNEGREERKKKKKNNRKEMRKKRKEKKK